MKQYIRKLITGLLLSVPVLSYSHPLAAQQVVTSSDELLRTLIGAHPWPSVRTLHNWLATRTVGLTYTTQTNEMNVQLLPTGPVLFVSENFLRTADPRYQQLIVLHEYKRLEDHFSGLYPLLGRRPLGSGEAAEHARIIWNSELNATRAEWQLAQQLGVQTFLPNLLHEIQRYGNTETGLIHGVYQSKRSGIPGELQAEFTHNYALALSAAQGR